MTRIVFFFSSLISAASFGGAPPEKCSILFSNAVFETYAESVGKNRVMSALRMNPKLVAAAEEAGRDLRVQKEMNNLLELEIQGAAQPGMGRFALGNGFFELRGTHGARLFILRRKNALGGEDIIIVGKATKKGSGNENEVFRAMFATFPEFPEPTGRYQKRQK